MLRRGPKCIVAVTDALRLGPVKAPEAPPTWAVHASQGCAVWPAASGSLAESGFAHWPATSGKRSILPLIAERPLAVSGCAIRPAASGEGASYTTLATVLVCLG